jgi:TM2 domain-containing membrane protein YozV
MIVPARKSLIVGYLLWFFFGLLGVHRFYTGRWVTGILWLLTGGLLGIGWLFDAFWTFVMVGRPK